MEAFLSVFISGEERLVIVLNTCFSSPPLLPPVTGRGESPPFLHLSFASPFFIKGPGVRRPISARLPFCEFNSEAPGLGEGTFAAPSASPLGRPRRWSRPAGAS